MKTLVLAAFAALVLIGGSAHAQPTDPVDGAPSQQAAPPPPPAPAPKALPPAPKAAAPANLPAAVGQLSPGEYAANSTRFNQALKYCRSYSTVLDAPASDRMARRLEALTERDFNHTMWDCYDPAWREKAYFNKNQPKQAAPAAQNASAEVDEESEEPRAQQVSDRRPVRRGPQGERGGLKKGKFHPRQLTKSEQTYLSSCELEIRYVQEGSRLRKFGRCKR